MPTTMPKFTPCLWFDGEAEEAARFYCSVFPRSKVVAVQRAPADYPAGRAGDVLLAEFLLDGQRFVALNGGPGFHFTEALSIMVDVKDQKEYDRITDALSAVPAAEQCGWIKDRYGVSWQLVPRSLEEAIADKDRDVAKAAFEAMMPMKRLDLARIQAVVEDARAARGSRSAGRRAGPKRPAAKAKAGRKEAAVTAKRTAKRAGRKR